MTSVETQREPGRRRPAPWLELGLLAGAVAWLFRDVLFFGRVYYVRDIHLVWHPQVEAFVRAIASGSWPVWNTSMAFGQPLLADPSAQILYPLTWLNLILRPWTYYTLYVVVHFVLAATGMRALARHLGLSRAASLLVAALFATSGPVLSMLDLWHHFAGACLMPWVVLACDRALGGGRRDVVRFGLVLAFQILAGSADLVAMTLCLAAALGAARHVRGSWPPPPETRAALARGAGGGLLALGLSAALWMSALELVLRAGRAGLPAGERSYWSMHPLVALEAVLPGLFTGLPLNDAWRASLFESREPLIGSLYLGVGALALVGGAAASRHPLRAALLGALVLALLVALGTHTPVYAALTTVLPRSGSCATPSRPWRPWRSAGRSSPGWAPTRGATPAPARASPSRPAVRWRSFWPERLRRRSRCGCSTSASPASCSTRGCSSAGTSFCLTCCCGCWCPPAWPEPCSASSGRTREVGSAGRAWPSPSASWPPSTSSPTTVRRAPWLPAPSTACGQRSCRRLTRRERRASTSTTIPFRPRPAATCRGSRPIGSRACPRAGRSTPPPP